jgi:hypothetical protein
MGNDVPDNEIYRASAVSKLRQRDHLASVAHPMHSLSCAHHRSAKAKARARDDPNTCPLFVGPFTRLSQQTQVLCCSRPAQHGRQLRRDQLPGSRAPTFCPDRSPLPTIGAVARSTNVTQSSASRLRTTLFSKQ